MIAQLALWTIVGCAVSITADWAFYGRASMLLRQVDMPGQFTYADSSLIRKIAIVVAGGLVGAAAAKGNEALNALAIVLWVILHLGVYLEWYRFAKRGMKANTRKA